MILSRTGVAVVLAGALAAGGCATERQTQTAIGTGAGAATGAVLGGAVGDSRGAVVGAAIGAGVGAAAGYNWETVKRKLGMDTRDSQVQVSEERDGALKLNVPGSVSFASGSATIDPGLYPVLNRVAETLREYPATTVTVIGHTDSVGSDAANLELSRERAAAVARFLMDRGVRAERIHFVGRGETEPVADNATDDGRAKNRRVEILVRQDAG